MKIAVYGMGYVGVVTSACLLRDGHSIVGVDPNASKVKDLAAGLTPIQEPGVADLLAAGHRAGRLRASTDPGAGIEGTDIILICVGTPSRPDGGIDLSHVEDVTRQIGQALKDSSSRPVFVLRSTVLPGTMEETVIPILEETSGLSAGEDLAVVFHPEFLREASAVEDFDNPPKIVVGEAAPGAGDLLMELYEKYRAPKFRLLLKEAEMVKYCDNLFHALKVTFANEVGEIARAAGVDSREVSRVFCADRKLNISARYLRPGYVLGGSCLPKDLRAILRYAAVKGIDLPVLEGILPSNAARAEAFLGRIKLKKPAVVGMVGLAFKAATDDMRESPFVAVAKRLIGEGIELKIYDPHVHPDKLIGSNKKAVEATLGHLSALLVNSLSELEPADLIVINHPGVEPRVVRGWLANGTRVMDLVGTEEVDRKTPGYEGVS